MNVYYITFALVCILGSLAEKQDMPKPVGNGSLQIRHSASAGFFYFLAACCLIFVAGFRYYVGTDFGAYYRGYTSDLNALATTIRNFDEPGFGIIAWIATQFYNSGTAVIFATSLVTISLVLIVIYRHTERLLFAIVLYIALGCWSGGFNGVRQYLAASILFCGYSFIFEKKFLQYAFTVFLAFLFHRSAIVMIVLYFIVHREISVNNVLWIIIIAAVVLFSYDRVIDITVYIMEKNYFIEDVYASHAVNRIRVIASCIPAIVFLLTYRKKELNKKEIFYINLTIIHAALCVFTMNSALLYRIGIYTSTFQTLAIPELLKGIKEDNNRKLLTVGFVGMFVGMIWYELTISNSLNNFRFIWH